MAKYPVRTYIGKYESWTIKLYGSGRSRRLISLLDRSLATFFESFPKCWGLEDYSIADSEDFIAEWLKDRKNLNTLKIKLRAVRNFWRWLIEDMGLPLFHPVSKEQIRRITQKIKAPQLEAEGLDLIPVRTCPLCGQPT